VPTTSTTALYGAFLVKEFRHAHLLSFISSFVRSESRSFVPTRASRAGAVKVGRRTNLAACSALARPYVDSSEHDGTLGAVGMAIRGELASGRGSIAPQPCIRRAPGTRTMMQPCASAAKLRSGGPILFLGITAMAQTGIRHLHAAATGAYRAEPYMNIPCAAELSRAAGHCGTSSLMA
jgi:hypothetical protein